MKHKTISLSFGVPLVFLAGSWFGPGSPGLPAVPQETENAVLQEPESAAPQAADKLDGKSLKDVIGIVDVDRALRAYPRGKTLLGELRSRMEDVQKKLQKMNQEAKKLDLEADGYTAFTDEWTEAKVRLQQLQAGLDVQKNIYQERFLREKAQVEWQCVEAVQAAIGDLAQKRGLKLVLRAGTVSDSVPLPDRYRHYQWRDVLFSAKDLDITDGVIKLLTTDKGTGAGNATPGDRK